MRRHVHYLFRDHPDRLLERHREMEMNSVVSHVIIGFIVLILAASPLWVAAGIVRVAGFIGGLLCG
jgi:hypothetical protein